MKLTEDEIESAKCALINETSDYILSRVCDVMYEKLIEPIGDNEIELDHDQVDEVVCAVFKGLYHERNEFDFDSDISLGIKDGGIYFTFNDQAKK